MAPRAAVAVCCASLGIHLSLVASVSVGSAACEGRGGQRCAARPEAIASSELNEVEEMESLEALVGRMELLQTRVMHEDGALTELAIMRGTAPDKTGGQPINLFAIGHAPVEEVYFDETLGANESFGPMPQNDPIAAFCSPGDTSLVFSNVRDPTLTPYLLDTDDTKRTDVAVIIFPGGEMDKLAWEKEGADIAVWLNSIGINAFVLKYRVPAHITNTLPLMDAQRAMRLVRHEATTLGINASRIGTIGFSSGGQLQTMLSTANKSAYSAIDEADSQDFMPDFQLMIYPAGMITRWDRLQPPTFIASARDDQCVGDDPERIASGIVLTGQKIVDLHIYATGRHGFGRCTVYIESGNLDEPACSWPWLAAAFLKRHVLKEVR